MKRKITTVILILATIFVIFCIVTIVPAVMNTKSSCRTLSDFALSVQNRDWNSARMILNTDTNWMKIENEKVLYWSHDVTDLLSSATPRFWKTLEYYLTDKSMGDKVIFSGSSEADYATLKEGKIIFLKLP